MTYSKPILASVGTASTLIQGANDHGDDGMSGKLPKGLSSKLEEE